MSSAKGTARRPNGAVVGYFRYNGTSDTVVPALFSTTIELEDAWRKEPNKWDSCSHDLETVTLHADYGSGFSWPGKVCLVCSAVREGLNPWENGRPIYD